MPGRDGAAMRLDDAAANREPEPGAAGATFPSILGAEERREDLLEIFGFFLLVLIGLELLESTQPDGPVAKYIDARGEGVQHVAFRVANIEEALEELKAKGIRLAVMDMWKPFRNVTHEKAPQAAILFDKFHVMRHLGEALDKVRKSEYARLSGKERRYIKGQKYTLLSRKENLSTDGRKALKTLLAANKRLNTAYLLKESFGQLWDYQREGWARRFFENWRDSLKWQRLPSYVKFAEMIDRHWDGIAAYCKPENKVSLGFVEGLNNKIRVIQRRAYGLRDEEYLRLKILTCMLPPL